MQSFTNYKNCCSSCFSLCIIRINYFCDFISRIYYSKNVIFTDLIGSSNEPYRETQSTFYGNYGVLNVFAVNVGNNSVDNPCPQGENVSMDINDYQITRNGIYICVQKGFSPTQGVSDITTIRGGNPFIQCPAPYVRGDQNLHAGAPSGEYMYLCSLYTPPPYIQDVQVVVEQNSAQNGAYIACPEDGYYPRGQDLSLGTTVSQTFRLCVNFVISQYQV